MTDGIRGKKDNIKYVLVFNLSRFARNTSDTVKYLQELASYGVGLLGVKNGIEYLSVSERSCDYCKVRAICVLPMLALR